MASFKKALRYSLQCPVCGAVCLPNDTCPKCGWRERKFVAIDLTKQNEHDPSKEVQRP